MTRRAVFTATVLFVACGLCGPAPAQAQEAPLSPPTSIIADSLSGIAAIRAVEAKMEAGVLHRDLEVLRQLWAEDFMVNAPRNVVVPTRAAVLEVFRKGIPNYLVFDTDIEEIRLRGGMATVMGRETVKPVEGGSVRRENSAAAIYARLANAGRPLATVRSPRTHRLH
jgi:hypothetical protein